MRLAKNRRRRGALVLAIAALLLAACSGNDPGGSTAQPATTTLPTPSSLQADGPPLELSSDAQTFAGPGQPGSTLAGTEQGKGALPGIKAAPVGEAAQAGGMAGHGSPTPTTSSATELRSTIRFSLFSATSVPPELSERGKWLADVVKAHQPMVMARKHIGGGKIAQHEYHMLGEATMTTARRLDRIPAGGNRALRLAYIDYREHLHHLGEAYEELGKCSGAGACATARAHVARDRHRQDDVHRHLLGQIDNGTGTTIVIAA